MPAAGAGSEARTAGAVTIADGRTLAYVRSGSDGPVVVLESGLGNTAASWVAVQEALATSCLIFAYDRAGLGASDVASGSRDLDALADDLIAFLEAVDTGDAEEPVYVVAHSWGGPVARVAAARRPDLIRALVLVDPTFADVRSYVRTARLVHAWWYVVARLGGRGRLLRPYADDRWAGLTPAQKDVALADMMTVPNLRTSLRELSGLHRSLGQLAELDRQPVAVPCTILIGARGPAPVRTLMAVAAARLSSFSPETTWVRVDDAGHSIPQESPRRTAQEVLDMIAGCTP